MSALPPGFEFEKQDDDFEVQHVPVRPQVDAAALKRLMQHRAWQMGKSPIQSIFSSLLMLYFSGNQLSLMSLMLCFMLVTGPIKGECVKTIRLGLRERGTKKKKKKKKKKGFLSFRESFGPFETVLAGDSKLMQAKLLYLSVHVAVFAVAIWKTWQLGILPITAADLIRYS